jgi:hypothetical protein
MKILLIIGGVLVVALLIALVFGAVIAATRGRDDER